jgi:hypothetical protein
MEHAQIVQRGTHEELMAQDAATGPDIYRRIYDMQARIEVELERELAQADAHAAGPDPAAQASPL